jgi:APA family basic amino acid/polyamine antiporter
VSSHHLKKSLGLVDATTVVAGSMIGSGIFIVTAPMARDVGSAAWIMVLWFLTGLITVFAALSYGELAGMMPNAGGQYVYLQRAYGKTVSFMYGWTVFSVIQTGVIAAVAVAFSKYAAVFFPVLNTIAIDFFNAFTISYAQLLSIFSLVVLTFLNAGGVKNGKYIQLIFTFAKLIALFALIFLGLWIGLKSDVISQNFAHAWDAKKTVIDTAGNVKTIQLSGFALMGALGATIINSLFSSDAWNNVTFIASEIREPKKNIPRSLFLGTLIVTIIYLLANLAYFALIPLEGNAKGQDVFSQGIMFMSNDRVGAGAAEMIFGSIGSFIMAGLILISTFGCNNGLILAGSRLFHTMAKDGLFFKKAKKINKNDVPGYALWIQCIWASVLCLSGKYSDLLVYSTFAALLFYILTILGIFILRKKEPNTERPYKAWGYPIVPTLYILITFAICVDLLIYDTKNAGIGLLIVFLGLPIYYLIHNKKEKINE